LIKLKEIVLIHDLKREGLSISAIARQTGLDRKTIRKHLERGIEPPVYGPRAAKDPLKGHLASEYRDYLLGRLSQYPGLSGRRLHREVRSMGFKGAYSTLTEYLRTIRPPVPRRFERRFETAPGHQAQVDFAEFQVEFTDAPGVQRKVWLYSHVLGSSRWLWGQFSPNQKLETVLRCHIAAFEAMGGVTREVLYDRMKTAVIGEDEAGTVIYNPSLVALLKHYGAAPKACKAYRAKTKGKVERPFRYIRQDFFLGRTFRNMEDLNRQFDLWRREIANARVHATTNRVVEEAFAEEQPALLPLPALAYDAVLTIERRVSHEGMVSVGGNLYSVPDSTRKRVVEVQNHPREVRIFEDGTLIARHPVLEGKNERRVDPSHRKIVPASSRNRRTSLASSSPGATAVPQRALAFYEAVGRRLADTEPYGEAVR